MAYDEEQQKRSRVVVETPTARREEVYTRTTRVPERDGHSTGVIAVVALVAIAATALIMFFLMQNRDDATNTNVSVATTAPTPLPAAPTPQAPIIVTAPPTQQPPVIVSAPPTTTQPAPVIVTQPAPPAAAPAAPASTGVDDAAVESKIDKAFADDPDLSTAGLTVTVISGKATLIGAVKTPELKARAERLANGVRGVKSVDSKITVE
jgi:hyperosmotically inducible periplasmic protein